jgi:glycerol-3-phosphate acyltransferase PlsY
MTDILWIALAFLCGSLPFSVWIGRFVLRKDIRSFGDSNPGATNVFRAGSFQWGVAAFLLDTFKAAIPVGAVYFFARIDGLPMLLTALAPLLGHAYSPFLRFRGGKAVAATFGMWMGLTIWEVPSVFGLLLLFWYKSVRVSGWALLFALFSLLAYLLLAHHDSLLLMAWAGSTALLTWKHRADFKQSPGVQAWVQRLAAG